MDSKVNKRKIIIITASVLGALLIVAGLGAGYYLYINKEDKIDKNTVAVVGNKKITTADLEEVVYGVDFGGRISKSITESQKKEFVDSLIEDEIYNNAAKRLGISVSEADTLAQAKKDIEGFDSYTEAQKKLTLKNTRMNLLKPKVHEAVISTQAGEYAQLRYDLYWNGAEKMDSKSIELKAKVKPIAEDLYSRIKAGTITFEQAIDEIQVNKVINVAGNPNRLSRQGGQFDTSSTVNRNPEFPDNVSKMKVGEIKLFNISLIDMNYRKDGAFIIARVNKREVREANSVPEWLAKEKNKLMVGVYYENAK